MLDPLLLALGEVHNDMRAFHRHGIRFDSNVEAAYTQALWIAPRLACAHMELPAVPGTSQNLPAGVILEHAGHVRLQHPPQSPLAQRAALMWAPVAQRKIVAVDIEDSDRSPGDRYDLTTSARDLVGCRDDVFHGRPYSRRAFS
jgi:hypothetical protein